MNDKQEAGPTGEFPDGQLGEDDRGELAIRMHLKESAEGKPIIVLDFGGRLSWLGLSMDDARGFARSLLGAVADAERLLLEQSKPEGSA